MNRFWDLLEQNVLVSSGIAVALVGATIYCIVRGMEVPPLLQSMTTLVLGYFFGAKAQGVVNRKRAS